MSSPPQICAGEKIQITKQGGKAELPTEAIKNGLYSDPLGSIRSRGGSGAGSLVPSLPAPATSTRNVPKKEDDNNWMLDATEKFDQDAALKKIFGIRSYGLDFENSESGEGQQGRKSVSGNDLDKWGNPTETNWLESGYRRSKRESERQLEENRNPDANSLYETEEEEDALLARQRSRRPELKLDRFLSPTQSNQVFSASTRGIARDPFAFSDLTGGLGQRETGRFGRTKEQENRLQEFQKLLGVQQTPFLEQLRNPLNTQPDTTRTEVNPVFGQSLDSFGPSPMNSGGLGGSNPGIRPGTSTAAGLGFFNSFNSRGLEKSSLSPAMIIPPPVPVFQPRPTVLEMPRRKF